jgi:hypothetical protein
MAYSLISYVQGQLHLLTIRVGSISLIHFKEHSILKHDAVLSSTGFLNRRAAAQYGALASIIPGPRLIEKRIYRAAV